MMVLSIEFDKKEMKFMFRPPNCCNMSSCEGKCRPRDPFPTIALLEMRKFYLKNSFPCQSFPTLTHYCFPGEFYLKKNSWPITSTHCTVVLLNMSISKIVFNANWFQLSLFLPSWRSGSFHLKFNFPCRRQSFPNFPQYCLPGAIISTF